MPETPSENPHPLINAVKETIETHRMFAPGDRVLVGVSGGPDSMVLLDVLDTLAPELEIRLAVAHLNHGLRGAESDADAEFTAAEAAKRDLPYYEEHADVPRLRRIEKLSPEEAARRLRYSFYSKVAEGNGWNKVALGHQLDDNAEVVLMFILRGSGPEGLGGIPPVRQGLFVRPLINVSREAIMEYIRIRGLNYRTDSTNRDTRYLRNRIRAELIPYLKSGYNPGITRSLAKLANIVRLENQWLEARVENSLEGLTVKKTVDQVDLSLEKLAELPTALKRRVYRRTIAALKGNLRRIEYVHVAAIDRLFDSRRSGKGIDLPGAIRVSCSYRTLTFRKLTTPGRQAGGDLVFNIPAYLYNLKHPGTIRLREIEAILTLSPESTDMPVDFKHVGSKIAYLDAEKAPLPLTARNVRPGDRFHPLGAGGTQKIKKYLIDRKIERKDRGRFPVVTSGNIIVWLAGHRIDDRAKVTSRTRRIHQLEFYLL